MKDSIEMILAEAMAVADSFAADYIDIPDGDILMAISINPDRYRNLFNAISHFLMMAEEETKA